MLYSGIHYNFSLSKGFFNAYTQKEINEHYLRLSSILTKYAWLPVLLTAASPLYDVSFVRDGEYNKTCFSENGSRRMSEYGYWNDFMPILDFSSYEKYIYSVKELINSNKLYSEAELYYPVRLKSHTIFHLNTLSCANIDYLELRMMDLNPLQPYIIWIPSVSTKLPCKCCFVSGHLLSRVEL